MKYIEMIYIYVDQDGETNIYTYIYICNSNTSSNVFSIGDQFENVAFNIYAIFLDLNVYVFNAMYGHRAGRVSVMSSREGNGMHLCCAS